MRIIPIVDAPSQTLNVQLAAQSVRLELYQTTTGFFANVYINDAIVIGGVVCENLNLLVRSRYLGFVGDLMFQDTQGLDDPSYPGLGTRFLLCYLEAAEIGP